MPARPSHHEAARNEVAAISMSRWTQVADLLRLRLLPRCEPTALPRFRLVVDLPSAVVTADQAMMAAWGRSPRQVQQRALANAARSQGAVHTVRVTRGPDTGARLTIVSGGTGTAALVLEPTLVSGPRLGAMDPLAITPNDNLLVLATAARPGIAPRHGLARLLRATAASAWSSEGLDHDPPILRCLQGNRLAIFDSEGP